MFRRFLILAVLLTGCSAQEAAPPPVSAPPSTTSASVPDQWNALARRAESAYAAKDVFAPDATWLEDRPAAPGSYEHGTPEVSDVCGKIKVGSGFKVTRRREWSGATMALVQGVHALSEQKAADLVEQIRSKARTCTTYTAIEGKPQRAVTPDAAIPWPDGVDDFYAYCETAPDIQPGLHSCMAYLARGDLLVVVSGNAAYDNPADALASAMIQLKNITPVAAQALAKV